MSAAHLPLLFPVRPGTPVSPPPAEEARPDPEALFHRYRNGIYSFIRRKGFSAEEADDLTQETLIRAFTHLDGFRGTTMDAWLYRIASNVAVDFLRKRRVRTVPLEGMVLVDTDEEAPGTSLVREERRASVLSVINELPACHRRILQLRYFEDRSLLEIAGAMNCTPMAAKLRVFRAVTALRKRWRTLSRDSELLAEA